MVVTGVGTMLSLTHEATMSAYGLDGQLLGTTSVPQTGLGKGKKKSVVFVSQTAPEVLIPVRFS